jgi:hypothetical protein
MDTLKRQWIGTVGLVLGMLALFVALGGPAAAAGLVTSKQIKNGTIQVKDISKAARTALTGQEGPVGDTGPTGPQGAAGPQGEPGPDGSIVGAPAGGDLVGSYPDPELRPDTVGVAEIDVLPSALLDGAPAVIPHNTVTTLNWGSGATITVEGMYDSLEGTRMVAPVTGIYLVHASVGFSGNATGARTLTIAPGNPSQMQDCSDRRVSAGASVTTFVTTACVIGLLAGQFVTIEVTQTSGVNLTLTNQESASMTWVGSLN